jgi:glycosyltransferase involved in cell wall biosynthesis|tara:strand:- start:4280 stop:5251 length:972 start_codon:yes stop_codon:yes gene_type:complete
MNKEYTVIVPIYCEAESITELCDRVFKVFASMDKASDFEMMIVDDGSIDASKSIIKDLCNERAYVKSIFLNKNFGKAIALTAGFIHAKGNFIITIDGDLQDNPEEIPRLIEKLNQGYDVVSGWKRKRHDRFVRVWGSWLFNRVVSYFGGIKLHDFNCGFKIYKADVIKNIFLYGQYHRFIPLLAYFMGYKVTELPVSHNKRKHGYSKYPVLRYQGFFDLMSILFTYKYRFSPLYFFGTVGFLLIVPSFLTILYLIFRHTLFVLGFGENYIERISLLLPLSTTICVLGVTIFLTGLVCDFILHHHTSKNGIAYLLESIIEEKIF